MEKKLEYSKIKYFKKNQGINLATSKRKKKRTLCLKKKNFDCEQK